MRSGRNSLTYFLLCQAQLCCRIVHVDEKLGRPVRTHRGNWGREAVTSDEAAVATTSLATPWTQPLRLHAPPSCRRGVAPEAGSQATRSPRTSVYLIIPNSSKRILIIDRPERADLRSSRIKILTRPTRPGCQTYLPSHDGQGSANQTTSRLPQARRRCFQAGRRDARPSDACHTDSLRRSAGRASSSRPASAPWCGADQASGSPPHRRVPKVPRTKRLAWHS